MKYFSDIKFINCGVSIDTKDQLENHCFDGYYGIQYHMAGSIEVKVNDNPTESVTEPHVFITYPNARFSYRTPINKGRSAAYVCFNGDRVERYLQDKLLELRMTNVFFKIYNPDKFLNTIIELGKHLRAPGQLHHAHAVLLLEELLLQLKEVSPCSSKVYNLYADDFYKLKEQISKDPINAWDFQQEANKLSLSYVHFRKLFQQFNEWSPNHFLLECRLKHSENLLINSRLKIKEIATMSCFNDEFHYSRIFKQTRMLSPLEFRKKYSIFF